MMMAPRSESLLALAQRVRQAGGGLYFREVKRDTMCSDVTWFWDGSRGWYFRGDDPLTIQHGSDFSPSTIRSMPTTYKEVAGPNRDLAVAEGL